MRIVLTAAVLLSVAMLGCVHADTQADKLRDDLATMKAEHSVDRLVARGRGFASVGDQTRAEQYLAAALEVGGDPAGILPELLRVCIAANRYRVAIAYAAPWLGRHPEDTKLRFVVAALRSTVGDFGAAREDLEQLVAQAPSDAHVRFAYAKLLHDQFGDRAGADGQFRAYLRLDPDGPHVEEARSALLEAVP